MTEIISIDNLNFEVRRSTKRKNVSIIVDRTGQLVVVAPQICEKEIIATAIESKKQWIYSKLLNKEDQITRSPSFKEYVSGEGFFYLGKSYRLQIIEPNPVEAYTPALRFFRGRFLLREDERHNGRQHFVKWYMVRSQAWIEQRITPLAQRVNVENPSVRILDLGYRWGSCSNSGINFHWRIAMLPSDIIEYLIVHELTHRREQKHSLRFWERVERVVPNWIEKKNWLAANGMRYMI